MMNLRSAFMSLLIGSSMLASLPAHAQDADAALQALDAALPGDLLHNPLDLEWKPRGSDIRTKIVDAEALTTGKAISARIKKKKQNPWDTSLGVDIPGAVNKGDEIQVFFWLRTKKAAPGKETGIVGLFVGRNEMPYDNILSQDVFPESEWKLQNVTGVAQSDYPAGSLKVEYQLGKAVQTVEIGPVYVSTLGPKDSS